MNKLKRLYRDWRYIPYIVQNVSGTARLLAPCKGKLYISVPDFLAGDLYKGERVWLDRQGNLRRMST